MNYKVQEIFTLMHSMMCGYFIAWGIGHEEIVWSVSIIFGVMTILIGYDMDLVGEYKYEKI